jgi:hypothetical protein
VNDKFEFERQLLTAINSNRDQLKVLLDEACSHWGYEDQIYRFYHQSWKVYGIQRSIRWALAVPL